jgi:hypothetical protein
MIVVGLVIAAVLGPFLVAAVIHHGYAWRNYQAIKAALPPARRAWLSRLGDLVRIVAIAVLAVGILWAWAGQNSGG